MLANIRRAFLAVVFSVIAGAAPIALADHGHGDGHGWGGGGWNGGGWNGGHVHVSNGHFGGDRGFGDHRGFGGVRFNLGYGGYGWPYSYYRNSYYRPYAYRYYSYPYVYPYFYGYGSYLPSYYSGYPTYYGYPSYNFSYPSNYFLNGDAGCCDDASPAAPYAVSRPVIDVAHVEIRLPDPQATIWVQGQEISSAGTVRKFQSPQLDPAQQYTYAVKAQWHGNGQLVEEERKVKVQANGQAVVDFTQPTPATTIAKGPALPDLPPPRPAIE